jgi:hypothetical protein
MIHIYIYVNIRVVDEISLSRKIRELPIFLWNYFLILWHFLEKFNFWERDIYFWISLYSIPMPVFILATNKSETFL